MGLALSENRCQVKRCAAPHHYSWTEYLRQNPVLIQRKSRRAVGLVAGWWEVGWRGLLGCAAAKPSLAAAVSSRRPWHSLPAEALLHFL